MNRLGLRGRLLVAQIVVLLACCVTIAAVAVAIAAPLFHNHLAMAGIEDDNVRLHTEEAFSQTIFVALLSGIAVALVGASIAAVYVVRRITAPISRLAVAAQSVAEGKYDVHIEHSDVDSDFTRLEGAFSDMAERLDHSDRVRKRLLADLAHELRTPVSTLAAYVDGLEDGVLEADGTSWAVMRDQLERLRRLAHDLSDVSAADEHALDLILAADDLSDIVCSTTTAVAPRFEERAVTLSTATPAHPVRVRVDRQRIEQILTNLLENALRHTPGGGSVAVAVTESPDHVSVAVSDTGEGIPEDQLESVFDRFHRGESSDGSGLGLTIARSLARAHGGSLTARPNPLGGTILELALPGQLASDT
ncbi:sensor histidine kinase [Rhodococcus sp. WS3]|uniref:sensor histidine kinase n=1 Tax=unclassified Rhodococcus (in: high G+C Gram-positive bacteria) TaxID=192944 RepID=UPI001142A571|nr:MULTISPECIES: ATP-binding protein [unclassified Rhodococcus (in: high G+C Gram-positive bacteria)]ROZ44262.1 sensor histidine kinase [Rhodococcus sp. WS3]RZL27524.1 MAG: HAMP domain-containing histidine kinase [Rhodococcus sp. (in: high G+C Gram-positive bacteria)]